MLSNSFSLMLTNFTFSENEETCELDNLLFMDNSFTLLLFAAIEKGAKQVQLERSSEEEWQR